MNHKKANFHTLTQSTTLTAYCIGHYDILLSTLGISADDNCAAVSIVIANKYP